MIFDKLIQQIQNLFSPNPNTMIARSPGISKTPQKTMTTTQNTPILDSTDKIYTITLTNTGTNKIQIIKVIREFTNLGLAEAKDIVDKAPSTIKETTSLNEAHSIVQKIEKANGSAIIEGEEEKPTNIQQEEGYSVKLINCGTNKIEIIKIIREVSGLGLKESKDLAEKTPSIIKTALSIEEARTIVQKIEKANGSATIEKELVNIKI